MYKYFISFTYTQKGVNGIGNGNDFVELSHRIKTHEDIKKVTSTIQTKIKKSSYGFAIKDIVINNFILVEG